jgi:hypothetical protein
MRYYATIKVEQTYEVEADTPEQAEEYFRNRGIDCAESAIYNAPDYDSLEIEEV